MNQCMGWNAIYVRETAVALGVVLQNAIGYPKSRVGWSVFTHVGQTIYRVTCRHDGMMY